MLTLVGLWLLLLLWDNVSDNGEVSQACNVTDRQTDRLVADLHCPLRSRCAFTCRGVRVGGGKKKKKD